MNATYDIRKLTRRTKIGGASAEREYGLFHKMRGIKLRKKYTVGGTAKDNSSRSK